VGVELGHLWDVAGWSNKEDAGQGSVFVGVMLRLEGQKLGFGYLPLYS